MAVTAQHTGAGVWEVLHTSTVSNTAVVITGKGTGVSWAVREDTTPPAASFVGHTAHMGVDREILLASGESLMVLVPSGTVIPYTVTEGV